MPTELEEVYIINAHVLIYKLTKLFKLHTSSLDFYILHNLQLEKSQ